MQRLGCARASSRAVESPLLGARVGVARALQLGSGEPADEVVVDIDRDALVQQLDRPPRRAGRRVVLVARRRDELPVRDLWRELLAVRGDDDARLRVDRLGDARGHPRLGVVGRRSRRDRDIGLEKEPRTMNLVRVQKLPDELDGRQRLDHKRQAVPGVPRLRDHLGEDAAVRHVDRAGRAMGSGQPTEQRHGQRFVGMPSYLHRIGLWTHARTGLGSLARPGAGWSSSRSGVARVKRFGRRGACRRLSRKSLGTEVLDEERESSTTRTSQTSRAPAHGPSLP